MPLDALPLTAPMRAKLKEGWSRLAIAARPPARRQQAAAADSDQSSDRAALVALALDRLAAASLHAASYGMPREVFVPDETTAAIFRAALTITGAHRCTDRLLSIVVRPSAGD
jgi:hypothetical protein